MSNIWILVAGNAGIDNLVATARHLGGECTALVAGDRGCADAVAVSGVDKVVWLGEPGDSPLEAYAPAGAEIVAAASPDVVLAAARDAERVLAGAVAARLPAPVLTLPAAITADETGTTITHAVFGGIAEETVRVEGPVVILTDGGSPGAGGAAQIEQVAATADGAMRVARSRPSEQAGVNLGRARRIVAVGRGVRAAADLAMIGELAAALGAEVACSRPLAEGLDWFPHDRYIGVTGQHVSPELYLAIGISGQLQHVVGCRAAGSVVVVNRDPDAPYFAEADYGIVGDLYTVVPALLEALR